MKVSFSPYGGGPRGRGSKGPRNRVNEAIRAKEVRVVEEDGAQLGIFTVQEAIRLAEDRSKDLVEIAPKAKPPVCKIIDYGKFAYEQQKKEKHQRKQQQQQQMKEIRFKWRTATHDFNFKTRHAREFIKDGNKVKATVMFRGREITHQEIGKELLLRFVDAMSDIAKVDSPMKFEGRNLSVVMAPDKASAKGS
ncbi:MAG: translation initiation factor IF-3 [Candidatus Kapaibacterium sp.]